MNARDPAFEASDSQGAPAPSTSIARQNVINVVNPGDLPISPGLYRVVWANRKSDGAFVLRFPDRPAQPDETEVVSTGRKRVKLKLHMPTRVSLAVLEELAGKRWVVKTRAFVPKRLRKENDELSDFEQAVQVRRKTLVSSFMTDVDLLRIFEYRQMGRYVTRAVDEHNAKLTDDDEKLTRYHVYQVVYRYWLYGCTEGGLISDSGNCGAPGCYRNPGDAKRGRPADRVKAGHAPDDAGINTGPDERALIWLCWDQYGGKLGEYAAAYRKMIEHYYCDGWHETKEGLWEPTTTSIERCPSLETFRYYVQRKYTPVQLLKQLLPSITWEQTKRALQGKAFDNLFGPAQTFAIDSTIADVYLVSEFNPFWIIGRPIVYLVRDLWSGMIVGLHVALEGPSWNTARLAIFNAFSPKGDYLRAHGFDLGDDAWPAAHGCLNLLHDRGESLSIPSSDSANDLGLILSPCPSFRPDKKGSIETMFHWIRNASVKWLPGAVLSRQRERGERDNRLDATLTLYRFTRILIHAILTFNKTADVSDRLVGPLAGLEIDAKPINLWRWGLENLHGSPPEWDRDTLYKALLPSAEVSIRPDGVRFGGHCYKGDITDKEQWQEFARAFRTRKIKVKYHPCAPRHIYVLNDASGGYETLDINTDDKIPEHARLEEIVDRRKYRQFVKEDQDDIRMLDRVAHDRFRDEEVKKAVEARDSATPPASKAEHLAGIQDKRWLEAQVQRIFEASNAGFAGADQDISTSGSDDCEAPSDLLSKLLAETEQEMANV